MSMNKGKAKAKPARKVGKSKNKSTAATAGIPKRAVMNRRKYNEAISGDTMSNYAMYKAGGKVKKYLPGGETETYADRIVDRLANDQSTVGRRIIKPALRAFLNAVDRGVEGVRKYGPIVMEAGSKMEKGAKHKKGGAIKSKKFAALAPPYDKVTYADKIAGAKKRAKKK